MIKKYRFWTSIKLSVSTLNYLFIVLFYYYLTREIREKGKRRLTRVIYCGGFLDQFLSSDADMNVCLQNNCPRTSLWALETLNKCFSAFYTKRTGDILMRELCNLKIDKAEESLSWIPEVCLVSFCKNPNMMTCLWETEAAMLDLNQIISVQRSSQVSVRLNVFVHLL